MPLLRTRPRTSPRTLPLLASVAVIGAACAPVRAARAQELQVLYDWRHSVDPRNNRRDFPTVTYQTYHGSANGAFLLKAQGDLDGSRHNMSKVYVEATQTVKFWKPAVFLHLEYTSGLGLFDRAAGGYYLDNAYLVGAAHPFRWGGAWASAYVAYRYTNTPRASHDPQLSLYWGRTLGGRWRAWDLASTGVAWTQNRNRGDAWTAALRGKRAALLVEHGVWYRCGPRAALGARVIVSENVFAADDRAVVYPALGVRRQF
ncbi:hypothetical protein tb265_45720 [Gemmatimonadetes bacterium T265]|nr:hypothetical protein tb265_45720 [Gemmatimonadetes bacterium T265]